MSNSAAIKTLQGVTGPQGPAGAAFSGVVPTTWINSPLSTKVLGDNRNAAPSGAQLGDAWLVASGGTGTWSGLDGHLMQFGLRATGTSAGAQMVTSTGVTGWVDIYGAAIPAGSQFIVGPTGPLGANPISQPTGSFANKTGNVVQLTTNAPQAAYTFTVPTSGMEVAVNGANALGQDRNHIYDAQYGGWISQVPNGTYIIYGTTSFAAALDSVIIVYAHAGGGPITVNLPNPQVYGRTITVIDADNIAGTNNITVARFGQEQINGVQGSFLLNANSIRTTFTSDGVNWFVSSPISYPTTPGVSGAALQTDAVGNLSWQPYKTDTSLVQMGITTHLNTPAFGSASGLLILWDTAYIQQGIIQWTSVGTQAGQFKFAKSGVYKVDMDAVVLNVPSGVAVQIEHRLQSNGKMTVGTAIQQSFSNTTIYQGATGLTNTANWADTEYFVYIPSGFTLETYLRVSKGPGTASMSPTGTNLSIQYAIGNN